MFFKPKKSPPEEAKPQESPSGYSDVYVMPEKYIVSGEKGGSKGLIIAAIILGCVILLTASYLVYDMMNRQPANPVPAAVPPQVEIENIEPETTQATTTPELATTTPDIATSTPTSTLPIAPVALQASLDSDNDALTNTEETVMGTLPTNPDTDGDGYKDGVEVAAGYNPTTPGSSKLYESPFSASLTTNFNADNFKVYYPKEWQPSLIAASKQVLIAVPSGEIIKISVRDNQLSQSALSWYLQDHPDAIVSQLRVIDTWTGGVTGIMSPNGQFAYLTDPAKSKFYVFEYLPGQATEFRYPNIFSAIVRSLAIISQPQTVPTAATTTPSQACAGYLCIEEPCGPLVSGQNSCLSPSLKQTCYQKSCLVDSDCASGQICAEISCWSGDTAELAKVCK